MLSSLGGEGGEGFFIAGCDEAEVGIAGVEEVVLVFGVSKGAFRGRGEAGLNDPLGVDDEAGGIASPEDEAMSPGGEGDF